MNMALVTGKSASQNTGQRDRTMESMKERFVLQLPARDPPQLHNRGVHRSTSLGPWGTPRYVRMHTFPGCSVPGAQSVPDTCQSKSLMTPES